jgi:hypothetical protein
MERILAPVGRPRTGVPPYGKQVLERLGLLLSYPDPGRALGVQVEFQLGALEYFHKLFNYKAILARTEL